MLVRVPSFLPTEVRATRISGVHPILRVYIGLKTLVLENCVVTTKSIHLHGDDDLNDKEGERNKRNKEAD